MKKTQLSKVIFLLWLSILPFYSRGQYAMEKLNRGVVSVRSGNNNFVSWRWLGTEDNITFNLYRNGTKVNTTPLTVTNYTDNGAPANSQYNVKAVVGGIEQAASETVSTWGQNYLSVPIQAPSGSYNANDCSIADVDGDGIYEILLKWDPSNAKDNSQSGVTDNVYIDCYRMNGTRLWRINLGRNIRAGAHYTQMAFYDFDGDGKAEFMCKTADATVDGTGKVIGNANADYRNSGGYILTGPEYLTVFNGLTGAAMATANYVPARGNVGSWGDTYGNRVDRFRVGVAYLDGKRPTALFGRGYYTRLVMAAWDWRDGKLTNRWTFDSNNSGNGAYAGQGNHSLSVADVDNDGKQEIISGAAVIDDDGKPFYTTGNGHGDAGHVSDFDPSTPGIEVVNIQERFDDEGIYMYNATNKKMVWAIPSVAAGSDGEGPARGVCADISASSPGAESWAAGAGVTGVFNTKGQRTGLPTPSSCNFLSWWDGDLLRELLNGTSISKYQGSTLLSASGCASNNGTKSNPCLSGDILGDWREEVIFRTSDNKALRIYTTNIPSNYKIRTLVHDPQYRVALAWQNGAYNQPPHVSFFLGDKMAEPAKPNITIVGAQNPQNQLPTVTLTAPVTNANYLAPASINISASASDSDGTISSVSFYNGTTLIGTDAAAPYSFSWTNVAAGSYSITAVATDNAGGTATSTAVSVTVSSTPVASFKLQGESACSVDGVSNENTNTGFNGTGYANVNNVIGSKATWAISATAAGNISLTIRFANGTTANRTMSLSVNGVTQIASVSFAGTGAWTTWNTAVVQVPVSQGNNLITLTSLTENGGPNIDELTFASENIIAGQCNATQNMPPSVSLTSPPSNEDYTAPATITLSASASDSDGSVTKVEFFNGSMLVATDITAPYSFFWTNLAAGVYNITAKATDNQGASTTSSAVSINVKSINNSQESITGPSCSVPNTTISLEVSSSLRNGATAYSWWTNGYSKSLNAESGTAYKANLETGEHYTGGDVCVGISYNIAPYYASYCKKIDVCAAPATRSLRTESIAPVGPNPSIGTFNLTAPDDIETLLVSNSNGIEVFRYGKVIKGDQLEFGSSLDTGLYTLTIVYSSGKVEVIRLQKL
ncbi:MAG: rhamnogalacturonan lyase [Sporocytophaga sp.]|uniref:rhamnogalacturonan lyase family protein n=1 Tax=Sporocytophaga sp. TaxID=2231183 RepID=UPI001B221CF3|nr:Ig-like domain-containing protein [Sporocytophaga sp.]MBO9700112.1 rhamnogalacturonan lyase [Sporocytophaga sp.]